MRVNKLIIMAVIDPTVEWIDMTTFDPDSVPALRQAAELGLPVLGICRGLQILNVAYGGSLVVDTPSEKHSQVLHSCENRNSCLHEVQLQKGTLLYEIVEVTEGSVNSSHHQAIWKIAPGMTATAHAPDGIIEAIEREDRGAYPYLMAVQWHPERMDVSSPMSGKIGLSFLKAAKEYHQIKSDQ
jgi:putative glutamine amidotransferase